MNPSIELLTKTKPKVVYPESDGQPMAENTLQFRYIVMIQGGLEALFREDPNVFVAGDLFWYPVEGTTPSARHRTLWSSSAGPRATGVPTANGKKTMLHPRWFLKCCRRAIATARWFASFSSTNSTGLKSITSTIPTVAR